MLEMKNVKVSYGQVVALDMACDITVSDHDIVGIVGGNGAGKSTLIKALTNQVTYSGVINKPNRIAVHLQENSYPDTVNCRSILEGLLRTNYKKDQKLLALVKFFDFGKNLTQKFSQLSGGQKQRLTIIMVLYQDAPLTCFDELSTGLDFETRNQLMQKIKTWYANKPAIVLLITHYFDELEQLANKLLIIDQGRVVDYDLMTALFQKYIGYSAVVITGEQADVVLPSEYRVICGGSGQTAIACKNNDSQQRLVGILNAQVYQFSVTRMSVALIYLNAINNMTMKKGVN
ncbi:ABC transporter ATP-binding protein [uncultured Leuconostoc sp.]|uniref:ATP-binding cassette domain-containing protein n=1 Tax=uncultured Leuconostoc sp. TaxID=173262 RepID=UPI0025F1BD2F|nr:ABC transporter ATP-binding protein [uncultured Leuconostoc sp.]